MPYYPNTSYLKAIQEEQIFLKTLRESLLQEMETYPEGSMRVSSCRKTKTYLFVQSQNAKVQYIPKSKMDFVKSLAQKAYDQQLLNTVEAKMNHNSRYLEVMKRTKSLASVYADLPESRKELITPRILDDKQYLEQWQNVGYQKKGFSEDMPEFYSEKGDRVRSKSEIIIADMMFKRGVPYRYEYPLTLDNGYTVYPDFTVLRMSDRKEVIWEHFGMMDDMEYFAKALKKLESYQKSGYILGENLLLTYETKNNPLETASVQRNIQRLL